MATGRGKEVACKSDLKGDVIFGDDGPVRVQLSERLGQDDRMYILLFFLDATMFHILSSSPVV